MAPKQKKQIAELMSRIHSLEGRMAGRITAFSGSMEFVYLHVLWFGGWVTVNHGLLRPWINPFDPFPYGLLTMIVSLEAIFLSTFIMVAQNRQALISEVREMEDDIEDLEAEREVEDIQRDLDDIKRAITAMQRRITDKRNATAAR
jgi:uncharacterized membrane protein